MPAPAPRTARPLRLLACGLLLVSSVGCATPSTSEPRTQRPEGAPRPLSFVVGGRWIGNGVSYGPHRDGQWPGGPAPTPAQLREDLALLQPRWSLWRVYTCDPTTEAVLQLLRSEAAGVKIILGAWIAPEDSTRARAANRAEVASAVRLANAYPDLVLAINVGNETQVSWTDHKVPADVLVGYLREVRAGTSVPVTTADDFSFWVTPESDVIAREVDFLMVHAYAMWNGQPLERAVAFTREKYAEVGRRHPGRTLVLGELGWATRKSDQGEQGRLIKGEPGEEQQRTFREQLLAWTTHDRVANLFFEAFDENWKGGPHPDEVEKHWGLFRADRTPKKALLETP
jgi:exo-beta-1,3-glucanase (GH17 family)